jgi:uncharacterized protein (DUF433 family)
LRPTPSPLRRDRSAGLQTGEPLTLPEKAATPLHLRFCWEIRKKIRYMIRYIREDPLHFCSAEEKLEEDEGRFPHCARHISGLHCRESHAMPTDTATHIRLDDRGVAWIDHTNVKVVEVVLDKLAHGTSPEEMHFQYPHLSLAQIYAALAYYYDHQAEIDRQIEQSTELYERLRSQNGETPFKKRLRELGKLR